MPCVHSHVPTIQKSFHTPHKDVLVGRFSDVRKFRNFGMLESLETQNADELEEMGKQVFELFKHDFGEFSKLSPSFHRAVAHSGEVARYFQAQGFTIGELSECAQEAINAPTKKDVAQFSFRGSHKKQNLGCLKRNWAFSDPLTMEYAE